VIEDKGEENIPGVKSDGRDAAEEQVPKFVPFSCVKETGTASLLIKYEFGRARKQEEVPTGTGKFHPSKE